MRLLSAPAEAQTLGFLSN